jgi:phage recombination protein Bet
MNLVVRNPSLPSVPWHQDGKLLALARRTTGKDCNNDEFDMFVSVCRDLNLSPMRKQIYCFVFSKNDPEKRNMTLVVAIDGGRAIAARSGNYQPDDREPDWVFNDRLKDPLKNPHGIEKCTVGVYHRPTKNDPFKRIVHTVYWDEFAPLVKRGDADAYEWVGTGEVYPPGHAKAGREKQRKQLRPGADGTVSERLDPSKEQWIRAGRNQLAKCAEMGALRKGWPEDLSRVVVEEETHRAQVIEGEYADLTPSEMADRGESDARIEKIGGPALFATFDAHGTLERVPYGQFVDRMLAATEKLPPAEVAALVDRNREALKEFWAHKKTDALELKKILEQRSAVTGAQAGDTSGAKAASPNHGDTDTGGAAERTAAKEKMFPQLEGTLAERHRDNLISQIVQLDSASDLLYFGRDADAEISRLPDHMQERVRAEFNSRQSTVLGR